MFLIEFIKLCDQLCFFILQNLGSFEIRVPDLHMHFVLSLYANVVTGIDSLLDVNKTFIDRGQQHFSPLRTARTLVMPLVKQYIAS